MILRYEAVNTGGVDTWWVADYEARTQDGHPEVAATFWGWVHPDPEAAAKAEADRLNAAWWLDA